jgi:hypothetical protein
MLDTKHPEYDHEHPDQSEIPLQAGSNKFASQKGMTGMLWLTLPTDTFLLVQVSVRLVVKLQKCSTQNIPNTIISRRLTRPRLVVRWAAINMHRNKE